METFGKICFGLIAIVLSTLLSGYTLSKLYSWILVPIYNLKPITVAQAIGLSFVVSFFLMGITMNMKTDKDETKSAFENLMIKTLTGIFMYGFILLVGYIISLYI